MRVCSTVTRRTFSRALNISAWITLSAAVLATVSCGQRSGDPAASGVDPQVTSRGTVEVTARLIEVPEGAIFKRDLYDYATVLKYQVLDVHRGDLRAEVIHVAHYNPWKSRDRAADRRVPDIGGNLQQFRANEVHRMALEVPLDDYFMGGVVNKYFGQTTDMIYWAVWTNLASE